MVLDGGRRRCLGLGLLRIGLLGRIWERIERSIMKMMSFVGFNPISTRQGISIGVLAFFVN